MNLLIDFIAEEHYKWVFSGVGVAFITFIGFVIKLWIGKNKSQIQKIKNNSTGIQVGGDSTININTPNVKKE